MDGNESITYRNLSQGTLSKNKLPPKRFGKQQPYTSEAGAAAYNTTGTGCDETQQVFTVEAIGL